MTVKDLKEYLNTIEDENMMVVVSGYEGGYSEVQNPDVIEIALNVNTAWYYGEHEEVTDISDYESHTKVKALRL